MTTLLLPVNLAALKKRQRSNCLLMAKSIYEICSLVTNFYSFYFSIEVVICILLLQIFPSTCAT